MWELIYDHLYEYIGAYMFLALALALFTGMPVAYALGGIALLFGLVGILLDVLDFAVFFQIVQRIWGGDGSSGAVQNPILVAIPCFVFMGTMLERSQVAADLLHILQVMLKRVPGGLALSVTVMGTIMAATTGIIGASVVMMTLLALPTMLQQQYNSALATGTLAASATLGILIPPSIMLVLMANLLAVSVGNLFIGAIFPGLILSALYFVYIITRCSVNRTLAPPLPDDAINLQLSSKRNITLFFAISAGLVIAATLGTRSGVAEWLNWNLMAFLGVFAAAMVIGRSEGDTMLGGVLKGFVPPIFLIVLVLGSIFAG
ncbi:MAG: TRAP transporter large permease subunit, partial [Paracoccaceae bacterium]